MGNEQVAQTLRGQKRLICKIVRKYLTSGGRAPKMGTNSAAKAAMFLKLFLQFGVVFGIYWVSQWIESVLPFPFPASVISLLLLLALLLLRVIKVEKVQDLAAFLLGNLAFFFVPVVSGMMNYVDVLKGRLIPIVVICLVSTAVTMGATAWAVQITCRLMAKRKGEKQ